MARDWPGTHNRLKLLLSAEPDVHIVSECKNGAEAISYLRSQPVDLLFLDIQMPHIDFLGVVQEIGMVHLPPTVFVTAYQEYAVRAFEIQAIDLFHQTCRTPATQACDGTRSSEASRENRTSHSGSIRGRVGWSAETGARAPSLYQPVDGA